MCVCQRRVVSVESSKHVLTGWVLCQMRGLVLGKGCIDPKSGGSIINLDGLGHEIEAVIRGEVSQNTPFFLLFLVDFHLTLNYTNL